MQNYLMWGIFLFFLISIPGSKIKFTKYYSDCIVAFYPIALKWEYSFTIKLIDVANKINPDFLQFVENHPEISWSYTQSFTRQNPESYLTIKMKRRLIPVDSRYVRRVIEVPIVMADVNYTNTHMTNKKN